MGDCCTSLAKYLLCLTNFVFFVAGGLVLSIGAWVIADKTSFIQLTQLDGVVNSQLGEHAKQVLGELSGPGVLEHAGYLLVAVGALIFVISFLGYCGALQESRVLLTAYGLFTLLMLGLQVAALTLVVVYQGPADSHSRTLLQASLGSYSPDSPRDAVSVSWDLVMSTHQCCGVNNYTDFRDARRFQEASRLEGTGRAVPPACCILEGPRADLRPADSTCTSLPSRQNSYYNKGCYNKFVNTLRDHDHLVVGTLIGPHTHHTTNLTNLTNKPFYHKSQT